MRRFGLSLAILALATTLATPTTAAELTDPYWNEVVDADNWRDADAATQDANEGTRASQSNDAALQDDEVGTSDSNVLLALFAEQVDENDPGREAYRRAREALNLARYRQAVQRFEELTQQFPTSAYVPDALYWRAYAHYRIQKRNDLEQARRLLDALRRDHVDYAQDDVHELMERVQAELAGRGDADAAKEVYESAQEALLREERDRARELADEVRDDRDQARDEVRSERDRAREERDRARELRDRQRHRRASGADAECEDDIRMVALNALLQMDSERALPLLRRVLEKRDDCWQLRQQALFVLSQNRSTESTELLLQAVRDDPHPEVRKQAVFWLSQIPGDRSLEAILEVLRTSDDSDIAENVAFALSQHDSPKAREALFSMARNKKHGIELRAQAIFWIGQHDDRDSFGFLKSMYGDLDDDELREKVIFSMSQLKSRESTQWLRQRALDRKENTDMRKHALFWLSQQGEVSCDDLGKLYDEFDDREMREQVIFGLSQLRGDCAVDKLMEIIRAEIKSGKDRELLDQAIFWLGQTNDPRALDLLQQIIEQQ